MIFIYVSWMNIFHRKGDLFMKLKEWAYLGNYSFYTNKLQLLATKELAPEKWSYAKS